MLGNDVVDLADPEAAEAALHPRFDGRVFTQGERARLAAAASRAARERLRWTLWAAKEAAFKVVARGDSAARFSPRRAVVTLDGPGRRGAVALAGRRLPVAIAAGTDRVHAVAADAPASLRAARAWLAPVAGAGTARRDARRLARTAAAALLRIEVGRVGVGVGREGRAPVLLVDGERAALALSLSHHGRLVACALAPDPRAAGRGEVAA